MNTIIVGTDGSDRGMAAVEWAAHEAGFRNDVLHIVHAVPWLYDTPVEPEAGVVSEVVLARGRHVLEAAEIRAHEQKEGLKVETELMVGPATRILLDRARDAAMVVVGAHGTGVIASLIPGSTALQTVTHAQVPTVVVRGTDTVERREILLAVDGAKTEERVIRFAFEEASLRKARLRAIHAWSRPETDVPRDLQPLGYDPQAVARDEQKALDAVLSGWREKFPDVELVTDAVQGSTRRILAGASARADLLVVGTRGRGGFTGLLLGSVSHSLLHHAHCSVAVIPSSIR